MLLNIYNIPLSCAFLDVLAERFLKEYQDNPLELSDVLFLLPNRRSCQSLAEAFVRQQGLKPTLLPQMHSLADVDDEEIQLTGFDLSPELKNLPPAMSATERLMIFTKIIMAKPADYGLEKMPAGQAAALAKELCSLMDLVYQQQLSFDKLSDIVPDEYAVHWQETLKFLAIITHYWPQILQDEGKVDAVQRQNLLLQAQIRLWQKVHPRKRIVLAGTTAAFPLMKELVKVVASLKNGEVILYGLDKFLSEDDWAKVDEVHPQFELKSLLDYLELNRLQVADYIEPKFLAREQLISEMMRPAVTSDKWRHLGRDFISDKALQGLHLVECGDARQEAMTIAFLMREVLEMPEKTAALVTADRNLARRVAAELKRWDVDVDDSAGIPLTLTPVGIFLRQILCVEEQNFAPVEILALMKHPLYANGEDVFDVRRQVRLYERAFLREQAEGADDSVFQKLQDSLSALTTLYQQEKVPLSELLKAHLQVAEGLASTDEKSGDKILWKGEAGESAARFMADMLEKSGVLGEISPQEYAGWLDILMGGRTVRRRYGTHPRLKILGPIEARLSQFDRVIIGEVNEGVWPQTVAADPWMSRPMKKDFGLPLPEKNIGVQAHDFSALLCHKDVYVIRAARVDRTPMVKSRWWMRLETVLSALDVSSDMLENAPYRQWMDYLDKADKKEPIKAPKPCPKVEYRPRQLPATAIEYLMRDPYSIFAKYILGLYPLPELEQDLTFADYGILVHDILKKFNDKYNTSYPDNAKEELIALGEAEFKAYDISSEQRAFWWPNFLKTVDWLTEIEKTYRQNIARVYSEIKGEYTFEAPAGAFTLTAKADRVDITKDGKVNIIDYKTGQARSTKEIQLSYAPQLPIEAIIAEHGGFSNISAKEAEALIYWRLGKEETGVFEKTQEVVDYAEENIKKLIALFDFETTPYETQPNPKYAPKYSDYEQLSRINEITDEEDD